MRTLLLVSAFAASLLAPLRALDHAARERVQAMRSPALDAPMRAVTHGSRTALFVAAAVGLVSGPVGRAVVGQAVVALIPVNLAVEGLKWTVGRTRPDGDTRRRNSSFPSSHAANAAAAASVLTRRWPRGGLVFALLAALVAFSRMVLDRHWLTDVTAGALLGVGLSVLALQALERWLRARRASTAS